MNSTVKIETADSQSLYAGYCYDCGDEKRTLYHDTELETWLCESCFKNSTTDSTTDTCNACGDIGLFATKLTKSGYRFCDCEIGEYEYIEWFSNPRDDNSGQEHAAEEYGKQRLTVTTY